MFLTFKRAFWIAAIAAVLMTLIAGCASPQRTQPKAETPATPVAPPPPAATATNVVAEPRVRPIPPASSADTIASNLLAWDATFKEHTAMLGETNAHYAFRLTNVSSAPIVIYATSTSCDCTVAQLPTTPWTVPPGGQGQIQATIDLPRRPVVGTNYVVVYTSKGNKLLLLKTTVR